MPPSYPWYPRDFMADEPVMLMTLEQEGAYRRLLDHQWLHGSIPVDLKQLAVICKGVTASKMKALWAGIAECFVVVPDDDARLVNERLERVREEYVKFRTGKSEAGSKGNEVRWKNHRKRIAKGSQSDRTATDLRVANASPSLAPSPSLAHTTTTAAVLAVLPTASHEPLDRLMRSSGNPDGIVDELARLLAVHPNVIPTGAGMRGESPEIVATCLVELANSDRPTWNVGYFKGMLRKAKQRTPDTPSGKTETPGQRILRMAAEQDHAA
jgi:uncharacterized protein YdaU (DUF1376 family)